MQDLLSGKEDQFQDSQQYICLQDIEGHPTPVAHLSTTIHFVSSESYNDIVIQSNPTQYNIIQPVHNTHTLDHSEDSNIPVSTHGYEVSYQAPNYLFDSFTNETPFFPPTTVSNHLPTQLDHSTSDPTLRPAITSPRSSESAQPPQTRSFPCPSCPKMYSKKYELTKHQKRHAPPCACPYPPCTRAFSENKDLERHINDKHTRANILTCERCGKEFSRKENLTRHAKKGCRGRKERCEKLRRLEMR